MGDTGLRDGALPGDEVQACCSLRGFSKSPTPSGSNIQLENTLSLAPRTGGEKSLAGEEKSQLTSPGGEKLQGRRFQR